jgi:hypothetical protein
MPHRLRLRLIGPNRRPTTRAVKSRVDEFCSRW